jgi:hypothetical protein
MNLSSSHITMCTAPIIRHQDLFTMTHSLEPLKNWPPSAFSSMIRKFEKLPLVKIESNISTAQCFLVDTAKILLPLHQTPMFLPSLLTRGTMANNHGSSLIMAKKVHLSTTQLSTNWVISPKWFGRTLRLLDVPLSIA